MTEISFLGTDSGTSVSGKEGGGRGRRGLVGAGRGAGGPGGGVGVGDYINSNEFNRALGMYTF